MKVAAVALALLALAGVRVAAAKAATLGVMPPTNPAADCNSSGAQVLFTIRDLDACRAKEGVGALVLPSNWALLTGAEQLFVLVNLERVNRGLVPVVGLSTALDSLATAGALAWNEPSFPSGGFTRAGGLWFAGRTAIDADVAWMYDDGPGGLDFNLGCPSASSSGCWMHRDIILWRGSVAPLVGGGGYAGGSATNSYAFEVLAGYPRSGLAFTWAHELRFFARKPRLEPLEAKTRVAQGPTSGTITITIG